MYIDSSADPRNSNWHELDDHYINLPIFYYSVNFAVWEDEILSHSQHVKRIAGMTSF